VRVRRQISSPIAPNLAKAFVKVDCLFCNVEPFCQLTEIIDEFRVIWLCWEGVDEERVAGSGLGLLFDGRETLLENCVGFFKDNGNICVGVIVAWVGNNSWVVDSLLRN
jgi:hypothetical protein